MLLIYFRLGQNARLFVGQLRDKYSIYCMHRGGKSIGTWEPSSQKFLGGLHFCRNFRTFFLCLV